MLHQFLKLEWKSFLRSPAFRANIVLKIVLGLVLLFYTILILFLGGLAFKLLKEESLEPLATTNKYLIYWWAGDLVIRYFLQKTPLLWVKPLLTQNIKKSAITHYLLGKSMFSFFNLYPLFFFIPFAISLYRNGYSALGVSCWLLALMALALINNFINLLINNKTSWLIALAVLLLTAGGLHYFSFFDITEYTQVFFQALYRYFWMAPIFMGLLWYLYRLNYGYFHQALYLDDLVQKKEETVYLKEYTWLNRFGLMGIFLKNDLRLLFRNKRARTTLWMSLMFLAYGLLFFGNPVYKDSRTFLIFASLFIPGGFLFAFGGFVPSWDSSYYPLMMSQNIRYRDYLASKWWLMVFATLAAMLLSAPYLFMGAKYYYAILAGGAYNIGVNAYIVLLGGAYTKTPIDLESAKKIFGDKKAFNLKTLLLTIPQIIVPIFIFYLFAFLFDEGIGFLALSLTGLLGLLLRNTMFSIIEKAYKEEKYDTLRAYKKKG